MAQGTVFGDYYLLGRLSKGGMAEVFLGKSLRPRPRAQLFAVKRILPELARDPHNLAMIIDESRIATGLRHHNICEVYDYGQHGDQFYIGMEFIHGKDLRSIRKRLLRQRLLLPRAVSAFIVGKIAMGLDLVHHQFAADGQPAGIVHRDVTPRNILISYKGVPKLIDFGIAKARFRVGKTQTGVVKGNYAYMSPEQLSGEDVTGASDIFNLGMVLYEVFTGVHPFKGATDLDTMRNIAAADFVPPSKRNKAVTPKIAEIIERALAYEPQDRFERAGQMGKALIDIAMNDPWGISETRLSAYLRNLFSAEYVREKALIDDLRATSLPQEAIIHHDRALHAALSASGPPAPDELQPMGAAFAGKERRSKARDPVTSHTPLEKPAPVPMTIDVPDVTNADFDVGSAMDAAALDNDELDATVIDAAVPFDTSEVDDADTVIAPAPPFETDE